MYDQDEMTTLHSASDCRTTAEGAPDAQQLAAVAYLINSASNCGETCVTFQQRIRPAVQAQLESNGYKTKYSGVADKTSSVIISWAE